MQLRAVPSHGAVRLVVQGELDLASTPAFAAAAGDIDCPAGHLIVDLRAVTFLDSCGLRAVLAAARTCADRGSRLVVIQGPAEVERVFALAGADQLLELVRHPSQAMALLEASDETQAAGHPLARWSSQRTPSSNGTAIPA